jgi:hypothetical protein
MPRRSKLVPAGVAEKSYTITEIEKKISNAITRAGLKSGITGKAQDTDLVSLLSVMAANEDNRPVDRIAAAKALLAVTVPALQTEPKNVVAVNNQLRITYQPGWGGPDEDAPHRTKFVPVNEEENE